MRKKVTAAELVARLSADPLFVARQSAEEGELRQKEQEYERAEAPLVQELCAAGLSVQSVWDFANGKVDPTLHARAVPILLSHLQRAYPDAIRDGISRALAIPSAQFAWPVLVEMYRQEQAGRTKDGLAVALAAIACDETMGELIALTNDPKNGASRLLLLGALERSSDAAARKALIELAADPQLIKEVRLALRRLQSLDK